jgi:hypothetical protein
MKDLLSHIQMVPMSQLASKAYRRLAKEGGAWFEALKDKRVCTYARAEYHDEQSPIVRIPGGDAIYAHALSIKALADNHVQSLFTILDSGWVNMSIKRHDHHVRLKESVTSSNYPESARILDVLLHSPYGLKRGAELLHYFPIDWQLDCKSGYHWDALKHYSEIQYGLVQGSDIKVPWELGRFTHAPNLASAAMLTDQEESPIRSKEFYAHVFRTQVLDFIAFNPPRFGVQWKSPMDCGLRILNMLIAYDMFRSIGIEWDREFSSIFRRSLHEHAIHIMEHPEWSPTSRGNHYLANLVGIVSALKGLPLTDEYAGILRFALAETVAEAKQQFLQDGLNFEASMPYHGLSSELLSIILGIFTSFSDEEREKICTSPVHFRSLSATIQPATPSEFTKALSELKSIIRKSYDALILLALDGIHLPNIGDNDSGFTFRMTPSGNWVDAREAQFQYQNLNPEFELPDVKSIFPRNKTDEAFEWISDTLDCRPVLGIIAGALQISIPEMLEQVGSIEYQLISSIIEPEYKMSGAPNMPLPFGDAYPHLHSYPAFGLWSIKHEKYGAIMRAGSIGQKGKGGHAHNDQLSFLLSIEGEEFFGDPGTFWYTPSPLMRNIGRSVTMHSTMIIPGKEQNTWIEGPGDLLFWMKPDQANADGMFNDKTWKGVHHAYGEPHMRTLIFSEKSIKGHDHCAMEMRKIVQFHCVPGIQVHQEKSGTVHLKSPLGKTISLNSLSGFALEIIPAIYSRAYGRVEESTLIRMEVDAKTLDIHWEIKI